MENLKEELYLDILRIYKERQSILGYSDEYLLRLINRYGVMDACTSIIFNAEHTMAVNSSAVIDLLNVGRLDLTLETLIISEKYKPLFNKEIIDKSNLLLQSYKVN